MSLLQWKSINYYKLRVFVCVRNIRYSRCIMHAPYSGLWTGRLYNILSHCLIKGTVLGKNL
jgi:hypothetical protein